MADKKSDRPGFIESLKELMKKLEPLYKLSLEEKIKSLQDFKKRKEDIDEELKYIDSAIMHLEYMPDVARYQVSKSDLSLSLLAELKEKEEIKYSELSHFLSPVSLDGMILNYYLELLNRAKLIEKQPIPNSSDYTIRLIKGLENSLQSGGAI